MFMFENPFKKQAPKPVQEITPANGMETVQDFFVGKLEDMQSVFTKLQSQFDGFGENAENLKLSPALASRAKIVLPVFMTVLATFGSIGDAEAQERDRYGLIIKKPTEKLAEQPGAPTMQNKQMTEQEWIAEQQKQAAEQKRQKDLKTAQNLKIAGGISMATGTVLQGIGMSVQDKDTQNALVISGTVLNMAGSGMTVAGNVKAGQAGGGMPQGAGQTGNPGGRNMYGLTR